MAKRRRLMIERELEPALVHNFRLLQSDTERMEEACELLNVSKSAFIRDAVKHELNRMDRVEYA